jgi:hypothetical protein
MQMTKEDAKLLWAALIHYKGFIRKIRTADSHESDIETIKRCESWIKKLEEHVAWRSNAGLS